MLKAIPTICLFVLLYFYIKAMLFKPLEKVLDERHALTEGARKAAEASFAAAERKQAEYEQKFADARAEVYRLQEETRRQWLEAQAAQVANARKHMEESVKAAKEQIAGEAVTARDGLAVSSSQIADQIAGAVLARRSGRA
ncbi:MAG TPA: ATP synthase F0 subunit B [Bryobacteraceae bacterium]|nr:ATP synthase F0 subunit B [Bryobacteraceae bacterium]